MENSGKIDDILKGLDGSKFIPQTKKDKDAVDVLAFLMEQGLINKKHVQIALAEYSINFKSIGSILISNSFVSQKEYIDAILKFNPDSIMNEEAVSDTIDIEILLKTNTMIQAETNTHIYLSTLEKESLVRSLIAPYINNKEIVFKPARLEAIDNYLNKMSNMLYGDANFVDSLIRKALKSGASDIHLLQPRDGTYSIFFRVDGVRHHFHEGDVDQYYKTLAILKDRSKIDLAEKRKSQDGAFQIEYKGKYIDIRVVTLPVENEQTVTLRLLDPDRVKPSLDSLEINRVDNLRKGASIPYGLVLVTGPTGSGKTTTVNSLLKEIDRFGKSIVTIEDPVEIRLPFVKQVNVDRLVGLDFKEGIRSFMRDDPDIIVVGEIRDKETATIAIQAAETGHLVIGTLHTGSIRGVIDRLKYLGVSSNDLRYLLKSVLSQRLARVVCNECHGKGCSSCNNTGYKGRTVVSECTYFSDEQQVADLIEGKISWTTIIEDAVSKVQRGITDSKEIIRIFGEEGRQALIDNNMEVDV